MSGCHHHPEAPVDDTRYRQALVVVLAINASMFAVEITGGLVGGSVALQADALDFFGDAATYALSLAVLGSALRWRAAAALLKGATMAAFGLWVIGASIHHALTGQIPSAALMSGIGVAALAANVTSAMILFRFRSGDSNRRSVWLCTRNDAIGNAAVIVAGGAVFGTNSGWPDVIVALAMGCLALHSAYLVISQARRELNKQPIELG
ncbi:MAG: cation transporter [Proteobacteria bacterium]|nr:cation transporter [Pseudomonadota bacterium]MDA1058799.1 cation transporter [Pseudomonadota bacterium]